MSEECKKEEDGSLEIKASRENIHCISIIGQIEGHTSLQSEQKATKYEEIIPKLVAIEESKDIKGLLILVNTVGGDVECGMAISSWVLWLPTHPSLLRLWPHGPNESTATQWRVHERTVAAAAGRWDTSLLFSCWF